MKLLVPILFALATASCWGLYGPMLGKARSTATPPEWSPFKPYVFIGVAYLVWAIVGGLVAMRMRGDTFSYSGSHATAMNWGFLAGSLGAMGALMLTNAVISSKGNTALVMPIVFGGAVTVNGIYSYLKLKGLIEVSPALWVGMGLVAVGIVLVAANTPHGVPAKKKTDAVDSGSVESLDPVPAESPRTAPGGSEA